MKEETDLPYGSFAAKRIALVSNTRFKAGLCDVVPKPDIIISGHNLNLYPPGSIRIAPGGRMAEPIS